MGTAKIEFKLGGIYFSGEGDEAWVASQLDKILDKAPELLGTAPPDDDPENKLPREDNGGGDAEVGSLAKYLQTKNAATNQMKRFLATAEWLNLRGQSRPATSDVTKALKDNHQSKLSNPADCLNKNVKKGNCEKAGKQFFVTSEGRKSLE